MAVQPANMKTKLFAFQLQGLHWMMERDDASDRRCGVVRGGILGDEMGLGKTLQAIGLICSNKPTKLDLKYKRTQTLVLCPASCLDQWFDELKEHAPSLSCLRYHGATRSKTLEALRSYDVLITTYGTVQSGVIKRDGKEFVQNDRDPLRQM
jgi:SNF2 family DNA or RNA helicase